MIIVGVDPSLRNTGLVRANLDIDTLEFEIVDLKLLETEKSAKAKKIRTNSEDLNRARYLYDNFQEFISGADMVFAEMPLGSQNASGMKAYGMSIMLVAGVQCPLIQVMPEQVKVAACNTKTATKDQMINWAITKFPDAPWLRARGNPNGAIIGDNEHLADAVGVVNAGLKTDDFKSARAIMLFQMKKLAA